MIAKVVLHTVLAVKIVFFVAKLGAAGQKVRPSLLSRNCASAQLANPCHKARQDGGPPMENVIVVGIKGSEQGLALDPLDTGTVQVSRAFVPPFEEGTVGQPMLGWIQAHLVVVGEIVCQGVVGRDRRTWFLGVIDKDDIALEYAGALVAEDTLVAAVNCGIREPMAGDACRARGGH